MSLDTDWINALSQEPAHYVVVAASDEESDDSSDSPVEDSYKSRIPESVLTTSTMLRGGNDSAAASSPARPSGRGRSRGRSRGRGRRRGRGRGRGRGRSRGRGRGGRRFARGGIRSRPNNPQKIMHEEDDPILRQARQGHAVSNLYVERHSPVLTFLGVFEILAGLGLFLVGLLMWNMRVFSFMISGLMLIGTGVCAMIAGSRHTIRSATVYKMALWIYGGVSIVGGIINVIYNEVTSTCTDTELIEHEDSCMQQMAVSILAIFFGIMFPLFLWCFGCTNFASSHEELCKEIVTVRADKEELLPASVKAELDLEKGLVSVLNGDGA